MVLRPFLIRAKICVNVGKKEKRMKKERKFKWTTTRIIAVGFFMGILIGSILLWLPISSKPGEEISYVDALFVATTSLCVTGLSPVVTATQWSYFGQGG